MPDQLTVPRTLVLEPDLRKIEKDVAFHWHSKNQKGRSGKWPGKWPGVEVYTVPGIPAHFQLAFCWHSDMCLCVVHESCLWFVLGSCEL